MFLDGTGVLHLVATPIGNMDDITLRALRVLEEADIIAAEDTRRTLKLLNHFGIKKTPVSYYEHNKAKRGEYLIRRLLEGKNVALVSDAGTPGISDPGEDIVKLAVENGIKVTAVPGPVAAITGLVVSGLPTGRFVFEGFLPMNKRARMERLEALKSETRTIVFYEAPHKLIYTLKDLLGAFGNRRITLARELTKKFEQAIRCTLDEAVKMYELKAPKGEFVLILEGMDEKSVCERCRKEWDKLGLREHLEIYTAQGLSKKEAMKKVAEDRGASRRDVYRSLLDK